MTAIGGRPVQAVTPPEEAPKREAVAPAGGEGAGDDGAGAEREAGQDRRPAPTVKQAPDEARGRTPTKGARAERSGSAIAETGARGQGFGLSTGGGAGSGSTLDVGDFCCPDYLVD